MDPTIIKKIEAGMQAYQRLHSEAVSRAVILEMELAAVRAELTAVQAERNELLDTAEHAEKKAAADGGKTK